MICLNPACKLAGQDQPITNFPLDRTRGGYKKRCRTCINSARHLAPKPLAPTLPPLEAAKFEHHRDRTARLLREQHTALVAENQRLESRIAELVKMQRAPDVLVYKKSKGERSDAVACAIASDWHVEEPVIKASVHGLNEYNLEVAKQRAEFFFKNLLKLTDMMARETKITTIYIAALGDFFSGWIHEELMASTLLAPGEAARYWKGLFISGIDFLLKESSYTIAGKMIPGNHGRLTDKIHFSNPAGTSLESFAYHALVGKYEGNPRVQLEVSDHAMAYEHFFEKFKMRLIHGYEVKYGGGVGGITIPINKALAQWDTPIHADLTVMGHFHQFFDGGNFMVNGSLIGYNLFAQAIKAKYEEAKQSFFLIHARGGGEKSLVAPIWLDDKHLTVQPG